MMKFGGKEKSLDGMMGKEGTSDDDALSSAIKRGDGKALRLAMKKIAMECMADAESDEGDEDEDY